MKNFRSREGLRWFGRIRRMPRYMRPTPLEGYSLNRMLLLGLIFPAIVVSSLCIGLYFAFWLRLPLTIACLVLSLWTFAGFAIGIFVMLKLTDKIMEYVKVRK